MQVLHGPFLLAFDLLDACDFGAPVQQRGDRGRLLLRGLSISLSYVNGVSADRCSPGS